MISFNITRIEPIKIDVTSAADDLSKFITKGFEVKAEVRTKRFTMTATAQVFKPEFTLEQIESETRKAFIEDMKDIENYKE